MTRQIDPEEIETITEPAKIQDILETILGARQQLRMRPQGSEHAEPTRLLVVDEEAKRILIDRIVEPVTAQALEAASTVHAELDVGGVRTWFDLQGLVPIKEEGDIYYAAQFPRVVWRHERRRYFRAVPPFDMSATVQVSPADQGLATGQITDVSVGGIGALFQGDVVKDLTNEDRLERSSLYFGSELGFESDLVVCFCRHHKEAGHTKVGFRIANIRPMDERKLARLIFKLQLMRR